MSTDNPGGPPAQEQRGQERGQLASFTVEFGDDNCRNFCITCPPLQGQEIRGRWDTSKMASRPQGMRDLGTAGNRIPTPIPGARLAVDVRRKKCRLFDPLKETDEGRKILERYNNIAKGIPALKKDCQPFDAIEYNDLDDDTIKTILYDLKRKLVSKCVTCVDGDFPTLEQIESLKGHELYDPGNMGDEKPRYKKDLPAFKAKMRAAGV